MSTLRIDEQLNLLLPRGEKLYAKVFTSRRTWLIFKTIVAARGLFSMKPVNSMKSHQEAERQREIEREIEMARVVAQAVAELRDLMRRPLLGGAVAPVSEEAIQTETPCQKNTGQKATNSDRGASNSAAEKRLPE